MLSIVGTYENGSLKLDKDFISNSPVKVIVTFLEDIQSNSDDRLSLTDFSFSKSQNNLENFKGSFSDVLIDERRSDL